MPTATLIGPATKRIQTQLQKILIASSLGATLALSPAYADDTETAQASQPTADVLSGPQVKETASAPTLIERELDSSMMRLQGVLPEEAAIELMDLTDAQRAAVDEVLNQRAVLTDNLVIEHLELVERLGSTRQSGRTPEGRAERQAVMAEAREAFAPLIEQGLLIDQLAAALPDTEAQQLRDMVAEYRTELRNQSRQQNQQGMSERANNQNAERAERRRQNASQNRQRNNNSQNIQAYLQEIGTAARRTIDARRARLDELMQAANATPDQEIAIRNLAVDIFQGNTAERGSEEARAQRQLFQQELAKILTEEQLQQMRQNRRAARAAQNAEANQAQGEAATNNRQKQSSKQGNKQGSKQGNKQRNKNTQASPDA